MRQIGSSPILVGRQSTIGTALTTTVPVGWTVIVKHIALYANGLSLTNCLVQLVRASNSTYVSLLFGPLAGYTPKLQDVWAVLEAGDRIQVSASEAGLYAWISGALLEGDAPNVLTQQLIEYSTPAELPA